MSDPSRKSAGNARGRPFPPGNPGKAKGTRNRATVAAESLLDGEAEALTRKAIGMALAGDGIALRLCLDRIIPPRRGRPVQFELPALETASDLPKALGALLEQTAAGAISPEEAATITGVIEAKRKALETLELEGRIAALEQRQAAVKK
jgi:hypothetical protein